MPNQINKIAVYCGAATGNSEIYATAAAALGRWLAEHQIELVYGGGGVGLMGILAKAVLDNGGTAYGVMPTELYDREAWYHGLTELEVVDNMSIRKQKMLELSDACIALPGGPGTLEEIIEAFSWARIGDNTNPCTFLNVAGYFDPLIAMFDSMTDKAFVTKPDRDKLFFSDSIDAIFEFMQTYTPPTIRSYHQ